MFAEISFFHEIWLRISTQTSGSASKEKGGVPQKLPCTLLSYGIVLTKSSGFWSSQDAT